MRLTVIAASWLILSAAMYFISSNTSGLFFIGLITIIVVLCA